MKLTFSTLEREKVNNLDSSDLELASNLSSSTEIEKEAELEEISLRWSKRPTTTNPIVRLNNSINQNDYRKHRKTSQSDTTTEDSKKCWNGTAKETNETAHTIRRTNLRKFTMLIAEPRVYHQQDVDGPPTTTVTWKATESHWIVLIQ